MITIGLVLMGDGLAVAVVAGIWWLSGWIIRRAIQHDFPRARARRRP